MADEEPEHIKAYHKKKDIAEKILDTRMNIHDQAYQAAIGLITDGEGKINYDWLKDKKLAEKFADKMADFYIDKAKKEFKMEKMPGKDEESKMYEDMLLQQYAGTTRELLKRSIKQSGKDFRKEAYLSDIQEKHHKELAGQLYGSATAHLSEEHIKDILKYTKTSNFVNPDKVQLKDAITLLAEYNKGERQFTEKYLQKKYGKLLKDEHKPKDFKSPRTKKEEGEKVEELEDIAA